MKKTLSLTFTGQAGFIIETKNGYRVGIDLYLSDCCNRLYGLKRLMPLVYNPSELDLDLLIATHEHEDHFDLDSVPVIMQNTKTKLLCATDCQKYQKEFNLDANRITYIKPFEIYENENIKITALPCDHGDEAPEAIGLLIEADGKRIYVAGDTCYREDYFTNPSVCGVDLFIMPINGAFGNLNEHEGAKAAGIIKAGLTIPCHFWCFAGHFGNPQIFIDEMEQNYPTLKYNLMRVGEMVEI